MEQPYQLNARRWGPSARGQEKKRRRPVWTFQRFALLAGLTSAMLHFIGDHTMFHVPAHKNTQNPPHQFTPKW